jgi:hypothetical protein
MVAFWLLYGCFLVRLCVLSGLGYFVEYDVEYVVG